MRGAAARCVEIETDLVTVGPELGENVLHGSARDVEDRPAYPKNGRTNLDLKFAREIGVGECRGNGLSSSSNLNACLVQQLQHWSGLQLAARHSPGKVGGNVADEMSEGLAVQPTHAHHSEHFASSRQRERFVYRWTGCHPLGLEELDLRGAAKVKKRFDSLVDVALDGLRWRLEDDGGSNPPLPGDEMVLGEIVESPACSDPGHAEL